jgi:hypothetical protein
MATRSDIGLIGELLIIVVIISAEADAKLNAELY